jgi:uncharacterized protein YhfF
MPEALGDIDEGAVSDFWSRAIDHGAAESGTPAPHPVERFGDSREMADELLGLVIDGPKRATAGSIADLEREGVPLPRPGKLWIVADGDGNPRAVLRTTDVRVGPLSSVDDAFAWDEGEGDRTRAWWLAAHERFFRRTMEAAGDEFAIDMPTLFERFEVAYSEPAPPASATEST